MASRWITGVRDAALGGAWPQRVVREQSRAGRIPMSVHRRIAPIGPHPVTSPAGNSLVYVADRSDMMARGVVWEDLRNWEVGSLGVFSRLAARSRRFLDVGAYTGIYSLIACVDGPGEAIAFEPNPAVRPLLEANVAANGLGGRVEVRAEGLSDAAGRGRLAIPFDTTAARVETDGPGPDVVLTTIDEVVDGRPVDVVKIDVEGLEPAVLRGGRATLEAHRPALVVECLDRPAFDAVAAEVRRTGYDQCRHLGPGGAVVTSEWVDHPAHANYLWTVGAPDLDGPV